MTEGALASKEAELMDLKNNYEETRKQLAEKKQNCEDAITRFQSRKLELQTLAAENKSILTSNDKFIEEKIDEIDVIKTRLITYCETKETDG